MKKYDFKRAILEVINIKPNPRAHTDWERFHQIGVLKRECQRLLAKNVSKDHHSITLRNTKIKQLRTMGSSLATETWIFEVYIKQYRKKIEIDYSLPIISEGPEKRKQFKEMIKTVTNNAIQEIRSMNKYEPFPGKFGSYHLPFLGTKKLGRTFAKDGAILDLYIQKNIKNLYVDKRPTEPKKYIGIELEFCAPIKENEFALKLFKKGIHKFAQLKKDGSLRPHEDKKENGYELAILLEESSYKKKLKQITDILAEVGAVTQDRRAGLHVHIDMRRRDKDLVYNNLIACQYALLQIVDPIRYNNEFCKVVSSRKFPTEFTGERAERYKTINAAAFYKYKTLEVRMHEGSVDYVQISNWVDLLIRIANYPKKLKNSISKISVLSKRMTLNKKQFQYLIDRSCFWQVQGSDQSRQMRADTGASGPTTRPGNFREITDRLYEAAGLSMENLTIPQDGLRMEARPLRLDRLDGPSTSVSSTVTGPVNPNSIDWVTTRALNENEED